MISFTLKKRKNVIKLTKRFYFNANFEQSTKIDDV